MDYMLSHSVYPEVLNMAMKISDALISILLVGGILTLFVMVLAEGSTIYGSSVDTQEYKIFNDSLNDANVMARNQSSGIQRLAALSGLDWLGGLFTSAWNSFKLTASSASFFTGLVSYGLHQIGLTDPQIDILMTMITAIILIIITFIILRMIFKEQA